MACKTSMSFRKRSVRMNAPDISKRNVPPMTRRTSRTTPPISRVFKLSLIRPRCFSPIFLRNIKETVIPMVIKPRPPIWIRTNKTSCPKMLQWVKVSTRTRPVTQVALVEVKRAVINGVHSPFRLETGSIRSMVPIKMSNRKPSAIICVPDIRFSNFPNIIKFLFLI